MNKIRGIEEITLSHWFGSRCTALRLSLRVNSPSRLERRFGRFKERKGMDFKKSKGLKRQINLGVPWGQAKYFWDDRALI